MMRRALIVCIYILEYIACGTPLDESQKSITHPNKISPEADVYSSISLNKDGMRLYLPASRRQIRDDVGLCAQLASSLRSNTSSRDFIVLEMANTTYNCIGGESILIFAAANSSLIGNRQGSFAPQLVGNKSTAQVTAGAAVSIDGIDLRGGWSFNLSHNASLVITNAHLDSATFSLDFGAQLILQHITIARDAASAPYAALTISAAGASVRLEHSLIADDLPGDLVAVSGDRASVSLDNVTVQSATPAPTAGYQDTVTSRIPTTGLRLAGRALRAAIARSRVLQCGAGGVVLDGDGAALNVTASVIFGGHAPDGGGGGVTVRGGGVSVRVAGSALRGNWADYYGGGIRVDGDGARLELVDNDISGNQARRVLL
jgi:hypothetical protein